MDGSPWRWMQPRADAAGVDMSTAATQGFQFQTNSSASFANELRFASEKSLRSSIIILASFNVCAAAMTAVGIFWDCYRRTKRRSPGFRFKSSWHKIIGPAEVFPFFLSLGILAQGIIFAVSQSKGLSALLILGCVPISQMMLPALFITRYIQFAFGLEITVRALWPGSPFCRRPNWVTPGCLVAVVAGLLGTYAVTRFTLPPNFCAATLFWFVQRWSLGCFVILTIVASSLFIGCIVVFFQLYRSGGVGSTERMTASRMVYFMTLALVENSIIIPFFFSITFGDSAGLTRVQLQLAMAASVAANLSGFTTGGLYVFLRSSRKANIGLQGYFEFDNSQPKRPFGSWTPYTQQMQLPVSPPRPTYRQRTAVANAVVAEEKERLSASATTDNKPLNPLGLNGPQAVMEPIKVPEPVRTLPNQPRKTHARKESYTLFPKPEMPESRSISVLPAVTYTAPSNSSSSVRDTADTDLLIPAPLSIRGLDPGHHRRGSSLGSSATVQIGFRVSNMERAPRPNSTHLSTYSAYSTMPQPRIMSTETVTVMGRASNLRDVQNFNDEPEYKQLPPVPLAIPDRAAEKPQDDEEEIRLSPTVYSPQKQLPRSKTTSPTRTPKFGGNASGYGSGPSRRSDGDNEDWI